MNNLLPHQNFSLEDMDGEIWKDIEGYDGYYQISNLGRVKSLSRVVFNNFIYRTTRNRILKPVVNKYGYIKSLLSFNNKRINFQVHRLVALHFINNSKNKSQVNHIDSNKLNNNVKNLEWVSKIENQCHRFINKKTTSIYVGVYFDKNNKNYPYRSQIQINKKHIVLGCFKTEEEAYQRRCEYEKANKIENKYL